MSHPEILRDAARVVMVACTLFCLPALAQTGWSISHPVENDSFTTQTDIDANGYGPDGMHQFTARVKNPSGSVVRSQMGYTSFLAPHSWSALLSYPAGGWTPAGSGWKVEVVADGVIQASVNIAIN